MSMLWAAVEGGATMWFTELLVRMLSFIGGVALITIAAYMARDFSVLVNGAPTNNIFIRVPYACIPAGGGLTLVAIAIWSERHGSKVVNAVLIPGTGLVALGIAGIFYYLFVYVIVGTAIWVWNLFF